MIALGRQGDEAPLGKDRQGQTGAVIVHRLLVRGGMDMQVAKALEAKGATQASVTAALKSEIRHLREGVEA